MKKPIATLGLIVGIIAMLGYVFSDTLFVDQQKEESVTDESPLEDDSYPVEAIVIKPSVLDVTVTTMGTIRANESSEIKSETEGKIVTIFFKEGQKVKKNTLLAEINASEITARIVKEKYTEQLNQDIESRKQKLLEKQAISKEEYDNALNKLHASRADVAVLEAQLEKTKIRAPFDGLVGFRHVSIGTLVTPSTLITNLYDISSVKIEFAISSRHVQKARKSRKIKFFTDDEDSRVFFGAIYSFEPQIDINTRAIKMHAITDNPEGLLLPGQFVNVELILLSLNDAIMIPTEAIISEMDKNTVYLFKNGISKPLVVELGIRRNNKVQVVSDMHVGDTLITEGALKMSLDEKVRITKLN